MKIYNWLGVVSIFQEDILSHFEQHGHLVLRSSESEWWTVWVATLWSIWVHRNNVLFNGEQPDVEKVFDSIRFKSWKWLYCKKKEFSYSSYDWIWILES